MNLVDLPELVLVAIFKEIDVQDLILNVAVTNKKFYDIVQNNSVLWRHFSIDHEIELSLKDLQNILKHSVAFTEFLIPCATLHFDSCNIDFLLVTELCKAKRLCWLDLTGCRLSTLCFIPFLQKIEILNLSECSNLVSEDFEVISSLVKLDQLYISFTNISPETVARICEGLTLTLLDTAGIPLDVNQCARIIKPDLLYFHYTPDSLEDELWLNELVSREYKKLNINIYRLR